MKALKEKLEKIVSKHLQPAYERGYAVSVEADGKSLLKHYSGNVEHDKFYPVDANIPFNVGSISKQFTACCIAILACEKQLSLDDSIHIYLPEMKEYADNVTIRHCLAMTAHNSGNFYGYCNDSYTLLGKTVEKLTGNTPQFAKQRIFDQLGMKNTTGFDDMGADGLDTTAEDLVLWHNCLMNRNLPGAPAGLFDLIFSSFTFNNGELCPYGFGFFYDDNDRDIIWQHGDMGDWQCIMRVYLKKKLSIIVLAHFNKHYDPIELALELENAVINELFNLPVQSNYKADYYKRSE